MSHKFVPIIKTNISVRGIRNLSRIELIKLAVQKLWCLSELHHSELVQTHI